MSLAFVPLNFFNRARHGDSVIPQACHYEKIEIQADIGIQTNYDGGLAKLIYRGFIYLISALGGLGNFVFSCAFNRA